MTSMEAARVLVTVLLSVVATQAGCADPPPKALPAAAEAAHQRLSTQISPEQAKVLAVLYPDFRVLALCGGQGRGADHRDLVLVVWKPIESSDWWKREVHRIALIWETSGWVAHVIDDELERDKSLSLAWPMSWHYTLDEWGFTADMRCAVELGRDPDIGQPAFKPLFDRERDSLQVHPLVCFPTDNVYNNWDCVVYSPKDGRVRLWHQQVHAD
jgi:hypothetical protein